jgi:hypothetical protein
MYRNVKQDESRLSGDFPMKKSLNLKAIVISAVLTALILVVAATAVVASGLVTVDGRQAVNSPSSGSPRVIPAQSAPDVTPQEVMDGSQMASALAAKDAEIAAYRAELGQAAQLLNDAYAQINALQSGQAQSLPGGTFGEGSEGRERGHFVIIQGGGNGND